MGLHLNPVPVPQFRRPRIQNFLDKYRISSISTLGHSFFWHLRMGKLFEGFEILCTDYDHMLEKRADIIQGNTVYTVVA